MEYTLHKTEAQQALNPLKHRGLPYKFDLNIYRGCLHNCAYCYARKSHQYLGSSLFESEIFAKTNIAEALDRELSSPNWKPSIINLGGVCDSYQPVEKGMQLLPQVLEVMIQHKNPVIISTKSDLILRDIELIDRLAHETYVNIAISITHFSEEDTRKIEPGSSSPQQRFEVLKAFSATKAYTGFHFFPILPFISDDKPSLETAVKWAAEARVSYMMIGILYLTGSGRKNYLKMIEEQYPHLLPKYLNLYAKGSADKAYKEKIHGQLAQLKKMHNINSDYRKFLPK